MFTQEQLIEAAGFEKFPSNACIRTSQRRIGYQIEINQHLSTWCLDRECWRPLPIKTEVFKDRFEVSNFVRIVRPIRGEPKIIRTINEKVALSIANNYAAYPVARLVARAFLGPAPEGHGIRFRDANRRNTHISNLEYVRTDGVCRPGLIAQAWVDPIVYVRDKGKKREPKRYDLSAYPRSESDLYTRVDHQVLKSGTTIP